MKNSGCVGLVLFTLCRSPLLLYLVPEMVRAAPVGSTFTYNGVLNDNGNPANGSYDFRFTLFDDPNVTDAEEGQVLQHLVADGTGTDDQNLRGTEAVLVPPADEPQPRVAIGVVEVELVGHGSRVIR